MTRSLYKSYNHNFFRCHATSCIFYCDACMLQNSELSIRTCLDASHRSPSARCGASQVWQSFSARHTSWRDSTMLLQRVFVAALPASPTKQLLSFWWSDLVCAWQCTAVNQTTSMSDRNFFYL
jgi:hypothetical protein